MSGDQGTDLKEREELNPSADDFERDFGSRFNDDERDRLNDLSRGLGANDKTWEKPTSPQTSSPTSTSSNRLQKALQIARGFLGKRSTIAGGGVIGLIISIVAAAGMFGPSLQLIHLRENMFKANKYVKAALENRRNANFYKVVQKINKGDLKDKVTPQQFADHFRARGFNVEIADDKITKFGYEVEIRGKKVSKTVDFSASNSKQQLRDFFDKSEFGRLASMQFDKASDGMAALMKGQASRRLYRAMGLRFGNWLDTKNAQSDKAETPREKFANQLRHANEVDSELASLQAADSKNQVANENKTDTNGDGKVDDKDQGPNILGDARDAVEGASEYRERLLNNPKDPGNVSGIENAALDAVRQNGGDLVATAAKEVGKDPTKVLNGKLLLGSINILGYHQTACTVNGTLKYLANIQDILLAAELAKLTFRILTAADWQRMGGQSSESIKLLALWLNTPDPVTGKTAMQAGGMLNTVFGVNTAQPSATYLAMYGGGRAPKGILGTVSSYVNGTMQSIGGAQGCRIVNNGFVQAGAVAVGVGVAVFTGGTSTLANAIPQMAIAIAGQVALEIGTVMMVKAASGMPVTGYESGEQAGEAIASGWGSGRGMVANANGMRPSTKAQVALMQPDIEANEHIAHARQSMFERYLDPSNGNSMLTRTAAMTAGYANIHTFGPTLMANISRLPSTIIGMFGPRIAFAADEQNCDDPQYPIIKQHNLQVDVNCRLEFASTPDLDADETEAVMRTHNMIDQEGNPIPGSEYQRYIDLCLSGRPSILYSPEVSQDGNDEGPASFELAGGNDVDNACIVPGPSLTGDSVGRFDRYAKWRGYMIDEANFVEEISGNFTLSFNSLEEGTYALAN